MKLRPVFISILLPLLLAGGAAAAPKPAAGVLTNARIAQMLQAGTSEKTIIAMIRRFPDGLDDGPDALVALRRAGASSPLLLELRANAQAARIRRRESAQEAEAAPPPAAEESEEAPEEPTVYGPLSLGLGYPFIALKRDFNKDLSLEGRFITRTGIKALAVRGYWNHYNIEPVTGYAGLEAGYVRFGTGSHTLSGAELSPFLGILYSPVRAVGFCLDFSPSLLLMHGGGKGSGVGKIGWVVNLGVFFRLPSHPAAAQEETPEAETVEEAAPQAEQPEPEPEPARRRKAPVGAAAYDSNVASADEAVTARDYFRADKLYTHLLDVLPDDDKRRVYLYERRGWLAAKRNDFAAARDLYLKAADAMRAFTGYDITSVRVYAGLGNAFERLGTDALAVRYYKRALEICNDPRQRQQIQARLDHLQ